MRIDESIAFSKRSLLCVQPVEDYRAALRRSLPEHDVLIVPNALEAIRALNASSHDAYVLDYWLPDWSGASLCRQIRQSDPHAPICFFTSAASPEHKKRALRAGAHAYWSALDDASGLATKLRKLLEHADICALRAKPQLEHVVHEVVERRAPAVARLTGHARECAARTLERAAHVRAREAFIEAGGTLATFDRWWPHAFGSIVANYWASTRV
jgi:CheY-like chemotaxis protein